MCRTNTLTSWQIERVPKFYGCFQVNTIEIICPIMYLMLNYVVSSMRACRMKKYNENVLRAQKKYFVGILCNYIDPRGR